jgi:hypothetical protein
MPGPVARRGAPRLLGASIPPAWGCVSLDGGTRGQGMAVLVHVTLHNVNVTRRVQDGMVGQARRDDERMTRKGGMR